MSKSRLFIGVIAVCLCATTFASFAAPKTVKWPVYKGSFMSYAMAQLPMPFAVYKFNASGKLEGVLSTSKAAQNAGNTPSAQFLAVTNIKIRQFIVAGYMQQQDVTELTRRTASLKTFMADMGYKLNDLIDPGKTYTLLLVLPEMNKNTCQSVRDAFTGRMDAVRLAIKNASEGQNYAVRKLVLGGMHIRFVCKS